jgi:CRP/FNR family transcriptional regulator
MELLEILSHNPVFSNLKIDELNRIKDLAITRHYQKGQWITFSGEVWPYLFIVQAGRVNAVKESKEGRSLTVMTLEEGDIFWGLAFFQEDAPMPVSLQANQDCSIHMWSQDRMLPFLRSNGEMSWELACLMIRRMQRVSDIVEELAFQPNIGRLARLLLENYEDAVGEYVNRDLTLDEMGSRIGTTREVVCRLLSRFAEEGAIQIKRTEFMIKDRGKLIVHAGRVKGEVSAP